MGSLSEFTLQGRRLFRGDVLAYWNLLRLSKLRAMIEWLLGWGPRCPILAS